MWNKYEFIRKIHENTYDAIFNGEVFDEDSLYDYLNSIVDSEVIYYSDCFDIVKELGMTDWKHNEVCDYITNINMLAYVALTEFVNSEFDYDHAKELIEQQEEEEELS